MTASGSDRPTASQSEGSGESLPPLPPVVARTDKDERVSKGLEDIGSAPYDPRRHTTQTRGVLAVGLAILLALTILGSFTTAWAHQMLNLTIEQVSAFAAPIISTEGALLGMALGFYFGDRSTP